MRRIGLSALALLMLEASLAPSIGAQDHRARASLEVSMAATTVRESTKASAGAAGLLNLGNRFAFGAGGTIMLGPSAMEGGGLEQDLHVAYGGVILQVTLAGSPRRHLALRALAGSGNAKIKLAVGGAEVSADNFGVLQPELLGTVTIMGPLQMGAGLGYRHVFGVDDLPNVTPADLKGPLAGIHLSLRTY